ncbi:MAG: dehydrogenase, partial [Pseudanabaenales cyanobacterium]|nr:dehydrogenase [Pseudanabaenales cyanobacterium]
QVISQEWGTDMIWARRLAQAFYNIPGMGYRVGVKHPLGTALMVKVLCGELRYAEVVHRALRRLSGGLVSG